MRPGLPDPLLNLLGARWSMGAPVAAAAWFAAGDLAGFGLGDGTVALARARWDGAASLRPRAAGGVELVPAEGPPPPVARARVHGAPCAGLAAEGAGGLLSGGLDGQLARVAADGEVRTLASFPGEAIAAVAARGAAAACIAGFAVHRLGPGAGRLGLSGPAAALAFAPAGEALAVAQLDRVLLWPGGEAGAASLRFPGSHRALAWSPRGDVLASGLEAGAAHGWRIPGGGDVAMGGYPGAPLSLSFAADGMLATSGDRRIVCWALPEHGAAVRSACGVASSAAITRVACHPVRPLIAAGYENGAVLLCQRRGAETLFVREAGGGPVAALAWSPDGAHLALATAAGEIGVVAFPDLLFRAGPASGERAA